MIECAAYLINMGLGCRRCNTCVDTAFEHIEQLKTDLQLRISEVEDLRNEVEGYESRVNDLQDEIYDLEDEVSDLKKQIAN